MTALGQSADEVGGSAELVDWRARWSDRLSPILVREVQQATSSRGFAGVLWCSCGVVVLLALVFALAGEFDADAGRAAFSLCLMCLTPIVLLIVPLQAFTSMRHEVAGGTAEQLLLTRLRPSRIVLGKLLAGIAQFVLFLGVFAPLMAMTFLLRGVDAPTIALSLLFAVLASGTATVFAIAMAAVPATRAMQQLLFAATAFGLVVATITTMAGAFELPREFAALIRDSDFWLILSSICGAFLLTAWLCGLIATVSLAHAYENRSTPFRAFAVGLLVVIAAWCLLVFDRSSLDEAPGFISGIFALCAAPIWLWAVCEAEELSPRVRTLVPRRPISAWLSIPFLPGGGRGLLFVVLLAVIGIGMGTLLPYLGGVAPHREAAGAAVLSWVYVVAIASIARLIRVWLGPTRRHSLLTFALMIALVALGSFLPLLAEMLMGSHRFNWHLGHVTNPFFTVVEGARRLEEILPALGVVTALALIGAARSVVRGIREVVDVARARRERAG